MSLKGVFYGNNGFGYILEDEKFKDCSFEEGMRYLKGLYPKEGIFERDYMVMFDYVNNPDWNLRTVCTDKDGNFEEDNYNKYSKWLDELKVKFWEGYQAATPFSYIEAFQLQNESFKALVFGTINIVEMIKELGHERIETKGKEVSRKQFSPEGEYLGQKEYHNIYETHRVFGKKLNLTNDVYAVRCWCTSTNKEHWIWIEDKYKNDPLEAIASTFRFHENVIPQIKELKRQGDIMLVEMKEEVTPEGEIVPLTAEQYFGLLTAES